MKGGGADGMVGPNSTDLDISVCHHIDYPIRECPKRLAIAAVWTINHVGTNHLTDGD